MTTKTICVSDRLPGQITPGKHYTIHFLIDWSVPKIYQIENDLGDLVFLSEKYFGTVYDIRVDRLKKLGV